MNRLNPTQNVPHDTVSLLCCVKSTSDKNINARNIHIAVITNANTDFFKKVGELYLFNPLLKVHGPTFQNLVLYFI